MKKQVIILHGGHVSSSYEEFLEYLQNKTVSADDFMPKRGWKSTLAEYLGEDVDVLSPRMPNKENAKYEEWTIWFKKLIPFLHDDAIFVCHSLGGLFFIKYLSENEFPKNIRAAFFIGTPYEGNNKKHASLQSSFSPAADISHIARIIGNMFFYHSKDDAVVPFSDFETYKTIFPDATFFSFDGRGHCNGETFPELVEAIRGL